MRNEQPLAAHAAAGYLTVEMPAELDLANRESCTDRLLALLESRAPELIVDMRATRFCDSSGVHMLVRAWRRAQELGCDLRLVAPHHKVRRVLDVFGFQSVCTIHTTLDQAHTDLAARQEGAAAAGDEHATASPTLHSAPQH
ncbi:STAS domain-containing protein [Salinactinospora qingdaonensis]|uniref:Anti-sigma factor antagonist n=1 Tax=Salinactinospora qingdaonensis TaxID=702744 RepID=A0ABP7FFT0_9ACTN